MKVFWIESMVHTEAWARFHESQGRGLSFVDWTTLVASRILGAPVFTFDDDFAAQGVLVVPRPRRSDG